MGEVVPVLILCIIKNWLLTYSWDGLYVVLHLEIKLRF